MLIYLAWDHALIYSSHLEMVKLFLKHGANLHQVLFVLFSFFVIQAPDPLSCLLKEDTTLLHTAAAWKQVEVAEFLIDSGFDVNHVDKSTFLLLFIEQTSWNVQF